LLVLLPAPLHRVRGNQRLRTALAYSALVLACFLAGYLLVPAPARDAAQAARVSVERVRLPRPQPLADFTLEDIDHPGDPYTRARLLGQWTLVYLGYSHCPDVCRPTLGVLAEVARSLRDNPRWKTRLGLVFVTVDPVRDTAAVLRDYLAGTDANLSGLRGSEARIAGLAHQLGIMHIPGDADDAGGYLVEHPATILLIDPAAALRAGFPLPHDPARIAEHIVDIEREFAAGQAS